MMWTESRIYNVSHLILELICITQIVLPFKDFTTDKKILFAQFV